MKVLNIHSRKIKKPINKVLELFKTLSSKNDKMWPIENWPPLRFNNGLKVGSSGGHGPIRYEVISYDPKGHIQFRFQKPVGFIGTHKFEIIELESETTEIKHAIEMTTEGKGTLSWQIAIRWLHDALIEDAFDKIENELNQTDIKTKWSIWVKLCRWFLKPRNKK